MTEPKRIRKRKASDYPPEFLQAWDLASRGQLRLTFNTEGQARNFRQQLHAFRKAMINENGQAPFAHWWSYDLIITNEGDKFLIVCRELDWKKQIREQAKQDTSVKLPEKGTTSEAVNQALANLGFTSK